MMEPKEMRGVFEFVVEAEGRIAELERAIRQHRVSLKGGPYLIRSPDRVLWSALAQEPEIDPAFRPVSAHEQGLSGTE